jgi:hypothetical protein
VNRRALARAILLRVLLPGAAGAAAGAFLTVPQAIVAAACLLGLWACWRYARP